ncbi:hypothetical protein C4571_02675 [Candidatus Parcubacteria bacterium]|nr:MAG: hypothetical protein C4571_02675 [Candidatus Parcubacteria bacterium]
MDNLQGGVSAGYTAVSSIPAPSSEFKIRTLASDVRSMTASGGGLPQAVRVTGPFFAGAQEGASSAKSRKSVVIIFSVILVVAALGAAAYYLYPRFLGEKDESGADVRGSMESQGALGTKPEVREAQSIIPSFEHLSFFRAPAQETLTLFLSGPAASASDLWTYGQKITSLLNSANRASTFFEITIRNQDGSAAPVTAFFEAIDGAVLDPQFVLTNFNPDFTYFMYRDQFGSWPGYILELKSGQNWLFLSEDVSQIEISPKISNLFLGFIGKPRTDGFVDDTAGGQPVRTLLFEGGTSFTYGWFRGYLIMSTSKDGLREALGRF